MLEHVSSRELLQWQEYEKLAGPLDNYWRDDVLASLYELTIQVNSKEGADEPKIPRPWELHEYHKRRWG